MKKKIVTLFFSAAIVIGMAGCFGPKISTSPLVSETNSRTIPVSDHVTVIDKIDYKGLKPNTEYVVKGVLVDQDTGKEVLDDSGEPITAEKSFVTETSSRKNAKISGSIDLTFEFNALPLSGTTAVVFERIYQNGKEVAAYTDLKNENTVLYCPKVTTAITETSLDYWTIADSTYYSNCTPGETYTITGTLMDKTTGKPILIDGEPITGSSTFVAEDSKGTVVIQFKIPKDELSDEVFKKIEFQYMDE